MRNLKSLTWNSLLGKKPHPSRKQFVIISVPLVAKLGALMPYCTGILTLPFASERCGQVSITIITIISWQRLCPKASARYNLLWPALRKLCYLDSLSLGHKNRWNWTARRSNRSLLKEISPEYSLEGLMLNLKLQYFGHLMQRSDLLEKTLMLGKTEGRRKGQQRIRWLDGLTDSMDMGLGGLR